MTSTLSPVPGSVSPSGTVGGTLDVVDLTDDHARLNVDRLPRSATPLGCRMCGLTAAQHGPTFLHRFLRPHLPSGHRYLDEVEVGDELALRRPSGEEERVRVAQLDRALVPNDQDLLWLRSARRDCLLLHPATVVRSMAVGARAA